MYVSPYCAATKHGVCRSVYQGRTCECECHDGPGSTTVLPESGRAPRMFLVTTASVLDGEQCGSSGEVREADAADEGAAQLRQLLAAGHRSITVTVEELPF